MSGSLDHSPADVVRQLLIDLVLGTDPDDDDSWPVYVANLPDSPDAAIGVTDTTGVKDGRSQIDGEVWEHYGIQIRVRHTTPNGGMDKARTIALAIDAEQNSVVTISSSTYVVGNLSRRSGPIPLGNEPRSNRYGFTMNYTVAVRQTT